MPLEVQKLEMILWYMYVGINMFYGIVDCAMIANNTFTVTDATTQGDGIWHARATCTTYFPSISYGAHEAWMVSRFGVPITNYIDYLAGRDIQTDPDGKWVMSSIGYASGGGLLTYSLAFDYDLWLGAGVPSGDCHQFTDQLEAQNFAENTLYPSDTPAATLIDTTSLNLDSTGHHSSQGSCKFKFPGIRVGAREAMILVSFTVPVEYKNDYIGNTILHEAVDRTWYIVKDIYYRESSADYIVNFQFTTSDDDISSAFCSMYVSEADALTAASLIGATTPQVLTAAPTTVSGSLNTAPVTVVTSKPTPSGTAIPVIIPHTARSNIISGFLVESQEMRNQYVDDNCLWKNAGVNLLQCVRLCLADDKCVSAFHHAGNATCTGHHVVYGSGNSVSGVSYYVFS